MKTYKPSRNHKGFLDLGISIALLTVFGVTTSAVSTIRSDETYQVVQCIEDYNLDTICEDSLPE